VNYEIDGAVGMYSGIFNNPFLIWGKFKKRFFRLCKPYISDDLVFLPNNG